MNWSIRWRGRRPTLPTGPRATSPTAGGSEEGGSACEGQTCFDGHLLLWAISSVSGGGWAPLGASVGADFGHCSVPVNLRFTGDTHRRPPSSAEAFRRAWCRLRSGRSIRVCSREGMGINVLAVKDSPLSYSCRQRRRCRTQTQCTLLFFLVSASSVVPTDAYMQLPCLFVVVPWLQRACAAAT